MFPLLLQVANFCKIASVFAFQIKEWFQFNTLQANLLVINNIDDNKSSKNIGLVLGLFLKLRLLVCLARVGNCDSVAHFRLERPYKWRPIPEVPFKGAKGVWNSPHGELPAPIRR